jgi:hypothetical protein
MVVELDERELAVVLKGLRRVENGADFHLKARREARALRERLARAVEESEAKEEHF